MSGAAFWDWAVAAWAAPGAAEAGLHLQDAHDQNIPLLLWAAWCAATGRTPGPEALEAACDTARAWNDHAVAPLRGLRRGLKTPRPDMETADREALRAQVRAVELEAERRLMTALEALAPAPARATRPAHAAMVAVARAWGGTVPRSALAELAARLPG